MENQENDTTSLALKKNTRDRIAKIGTLDDSFDDVLNRLCWFWETYREGVKLEKK